MRIAIIPGKIRVLNELCRRRSMNRIVNLGAMGHTERNKREGVAIVVQMKNKAKQRAPIECPSNLSHTLQLRISPGTKRLQRALAD